MNEILNSLIEWATRAVIPALLIAVIYIADSVTRRATEGSEHRLSVRAGYWGGFVAFIIFSNSLTEIEKVVLPEAFLMVAPFWAFPTAVLLGYFIVYLIKTTIPTRFGGFAVMLMVFLGASSLITYVGIPNATLTELIRWWTLGLAFGVLVHAVINPTSITEFYPHEDQNPFKKLVGDRSPERPKETSFAAPPSTTEQKQADVPAPKEGQQ